MNSGVCKRFFDHRVPGKEGCQRSRENKGMPSIKGVLLLLVPVLLLSSSACAASATRTEAVGAADSPIVFLPSWPDPVTDVLFNMQVRRFEDFFEVARLAGRKLAEPQFQVAVRDWAWFETPGRNSMSTSHDIGGGTLGISSIPYAQLFDSARLPVDTLVSLSSVPRRLELLIRFGDGGASTPLPDCTVSEGRGRVSAYGNEWEADHEICLSPRCQLSEVLDAIRGSNGAVGILYFPNKFLEARVPDWRLSQGRFAMRRSIRWSRAIVEEARDFVERELGGGSFVGIHWRRGDRALEVEMGIHGVVDVALTAPTRLVDFVEAIMADKGIKTCFLATNSGNADELDYVTKALGCRTRSASPDWRAFTADAVIEQAILSASSFLIVPPGVGDPTNVMDTSNLSLFVLEERLIRRAEKLSSGAGSARAPAAAAVSAQELLNTSDDYAICCGTSPAAAMWRPRQGDAISGHALTFEAWAAFLFPGSEIYLTLWSHARDLKPTIVMSVAVPYPGRIQVMGLTPGEYTAQATFGGGRDEDEYGAPAPDGSPSPVNFTMIEADEDGGEVGGQGARERGVDTMWVGGAGDKSESVAWLANIIGDGLHLNSKARGDPLCVLRVVRRDTAECMRECSLDERCAAFAEGQAQEEEEEEEEEEELQRRARGCLLLIADRQLAASEMAMVSRFLIHSGGLGAGAWVRLHTQGRRRWESGWFGQDQDEAEVMSSLQQAEEEHDEAGAVESAHSRGCLPLHYVCMRAHHAYN